MSWLQLSSDIEVLTLTPLASPLHSHAGAVGPGMLHTSYDRQGIVREVLFLFMHRALRAGRLR